ncbi:MAG: prepilin-type N-terminal cleavage/methylation domain-containing protein [Gudongella sp.]|nr:prepilin-type N-terminal cleavage/methylation domain-containing protein [Gudongella sp.]
MKSAESSRGFTLIEIIVGLGIASIVISGLFSVLHLSTITTKMVEDEDNGLITAIYTYEYIIDEIKRADGFYPVGIVEGLKQKYPDNFGFVMVNQDKHIMYYLGDGNIRRVACDVVEGSMPLYNDFAGHNNISDSIVSISGTSMNTELEIIDLKISFSLPNGKIKSYTTSVSIKGRVIKGDT